MGNIELKVDPEVLVQLKPFLEKNDFSGAYRKINEIPKNTYKFTKLFLDCGIDPLDYMTEVPDYYADGLEDHQFSIPDHVKKVGCFAFSNAEIYTANLENVESVLFKAFFRCKSLNNVKIGDHLDWIPPSCFGYCTSLKTVELPVNIRLVSSNAFEGCFNLLHIIIHNPKCEINFDAYNNSFSLCSKES